MESRLCVSLGITIPEGEAYPFRGIRFVSDGAKAEATFLAERRTESGAPICIASCWIMRRLAAFACCGRRRSPGFIRKARWWLENWCARAGWWAPMEPVPASADWAKLDQHELDAPARTRICASDSAATTASRPGPTSWNCTGAVTARSMSRPSAAKKFVWR